MLGRALAEVMAAYGWTPRDVDACTLGELFDAWGGAMHQRRQRLGESAIGARLAAHGKGPEFKKWLMQMLDG